VHVSSIPPLEPATQSSPHVLPSGQGPQRPQVVQVGFGHDPHTMHPHGAGQAVGRGMQA
jgi:hypothetical protein